MGLDNLIFVFWMLSFKTAFSLSSFTRSHKSMPLWFGALEISTFCIMDFLNNLLYAIIILESGKKSIKMPSKQYRTRKIRNIEIEKASVQLLSRVRLFVTPWIAARQASLSITNSWSSLKLRSIESVMPSSHLILCHPLFLLPPIPPSLRVFKWWCHLHIWGYWYFSQQSWFQLVFLPAQRFSWYTLNIS